MGGLWVTMIFMAVVEVVILVKNKLWGELWAFGFLWLIASVFASLVAARTVLPSLVLVVSEFFTIPF